MPSFNGYSAIGKGKFQGVIIVGCNSRYFARGGYCGGNLHQCGFWDGFGGAGSFAEGVVGAADPHWAGGSDLPAVVLAAPGAGDHAAERVFPGGLRFAVLLRSAVHFQLYRVIGTDINDRLVGVGGVVLGQLTVIHQSAFGQVVLPEFGLKQKVSGVGVILENPGDGALVPGESLLGQDTLLSLIEHWNKLEHSLTGTTRTLITRKSELSKITAEQSSRFQIYTLKDDIVDGEEAVSDDAAEKQKQDIHAKIYLRKKYSDVDLYLGSMNATYSAVNKNVEMMIRLRTKNRYYNSEMFLRDLFCGKDDNPQNPFEPSSVTEAISDPQQENANQLEQVIKTVCRLPMKASVIERDGKYDVSLEISGQIPEGNISITPFRRNVPMPLENSMLFPQLDILQVSEFYMVRVTTGDMTVDRIIMIPTMGIPEGRENAVVNSVVKDKRTFVEYVAFVLGDSYLLSLMEERSLAGSGSWNNGHESLPALYEKMLKTALEEPEKIGEIGYLLQMITKEDIVPDEFRELYATFKKTLRLK